MNRRHAALILPDSASLTETQAAALTRYGTTSTAASGPGQETASTTRPAKIHSTTENRTVLRAPNTVAIEPMPAFRSGRTSWTAPKAWAAIPQRKKATSTTTTSKVASAAASASPTTAGLTKWVRDVAEPRQGRCLTRSAAAAD